MAVATSKSRITDDLDLVFHIKNEINPETGQDDFVIEKYKILQRDLFQVDKDRLIGQYCSHTLPEYIQESIFKMMRQVLKSDLARTEIVEWHDGSGNPTFSLFKDEEIHWLKVHIISLGNDRLMVLVRNETPQMRRDILYDSRAKTLEKLASGKPLREVLEVLAITTEDNFPGMMCSILLYDRETELLSLGAAPNLPMTYSKAIEGIRVGPDVGSCGRAAYCGEIVISEDLEQDPNWKNFIHLARDAGLACCWSFPIFSKDSEVLGTFALYYSHPRVPSDEDCRIIKESAHLAGIAISHSVAEYKTLVALEEARQANKAKTEFLANMSHELRTPLNAILGFSEVMSERMFGDLSEKYRDYAEKIHESGTLLLSLISDLLDVSRIEQGKFKIEKEPVDLDDMISGTLSVVEEWASDAGIKLHHERACNSCSLMADKRSIQQVLLNLVSNAIKFTGVGGDVRVSCMECSADSIAIVVSDTGIGIPEEQIVKITKPFQQVGNIYSRTYQGVGLGLYIVSEIVKLHKGELEIKSCPGKGTTVRVILPIS
ncbi:GAF domain-containing sensor histidine kinase [Emcibacter sp.]|uniref:GAF domain-containing sensor histidine kinase n=1 Tax=Emcibacter sp. TaxID=1979954 RepID=UPI003A92D32F